jgi:hypothetical protein
MNGFCGINRSGTREAAIDSLMRHVRTEHNEDWFEIEEIYRAASQVLREKAA